MFRELLNPRNPWGLPKGPQAPTKHKRSDAKSPIVYTDMTDLEASLAFLVDGLNSLKVAVKVIPTPLSPPTPTPAPSCPKVDVESPLFKSFVSMAETPEDFKFPQQSHESVVPVLAKEPPAIIVTSPSLESINKYKIDLYFAPPSVLTAASNLVPNILDPELVDPTCAEPHTTSEEPNEMWSDSDDEDFGPPPKSLYMHSRHNVSTNDLSVFATHPDPSEATAAHSSPSLPRTTSAYYQLTSDSHSGSPKTRTPDRSLSRMSFFDTSDDDDSDSDDDGIAPSAKYKLWASTCPSANASPPRGVPLPLTGTKNQYTAGKDASNAPKLGSVFEEDEEEDGEEAEAPLKATNNYRWYKAVRVSRATDLPTVSEDEEEPQTKIQDSALTRIQVQPLLTTSSNVEESDHTSMHSVEKVVAPIHSHTTTNLPPTRNLPPLPLKVLCDGGNADHPAHNIHVSPPSHISVSDSLIAASPGTLAKKGVHKRHNSPALSVIQVQDENYRRWLIPQQTSKAISMINYIPFPSFDGPGSEQLVEDEIMPLKIEDVYTPTHAVELCETKEMLDVVSEDEVAPVGIQDRSTDQSETKNHPIILVVDVDDQASQPKVIHTGFPSELSLPYAPYHPETNCQKEIKKSKVSRMANFLAKTVRSIRTRLSAAKMKA